MLRLLKLHLISSTASNEYERKREREKKKGTGKSKSSVHYCDLSGRKTKTNKEQNKTIQNKRKQM